MTFGSRLRAAMKSRGRRAADLARLCNVRPQTVSKWTNMTEARLEARHAFCVADALHINARKLVTGNANRVALHTK